MLTADQACRPQQNANKHGENFEISVFSHCSELILEYYKIKQLYDAELCRTQRKMKLAYPNSSGFNKSVNKLAIYNNKIITAKSRHFLCALDQCGILFQVFDFFCFCALTIENKSMLILPVTKNNGMVKNKPRCEKA